MGRKKKYHINLTDEEVKRLKATIKRKKTSRSVCRRCQILLDLDEAHGEVLTHKQSARSNGVCEATVAAVILRYVTGGIDGVIKYKRNPNSDNTGRKVDGRAEAKIIQVACGPVPEGHARWTLRLLAEKLKLELEIPVGKDAVRRTLKKTSFSLTAKTIGAKVKREMLNL